MANAPARDWFCLAEAVDDCDCLVVAQDRREAARLGDAITWTGFALADREADRGSDLLTQRAAWTRLTAV